MCRDPEAAKDVLQETLIAAARTVAAASRAGRRTAARGTQPYPW